MLWLTWVVLVGMAVAMYLIIYKYEKKMDTLHEMIEQNRSTIEENHSRIKENHSKLKEHHTMIDQMWVTIPKTKEK